MSDTATAFLAREARYDVHDGADEVLLSGGESQSWLAIRRREAPAPEPGTPPGETWPIEVEYGPPATAASAIVDFCEFTPGKLHLKLEQPLNGVDDFHVRLELAALARERVVAGLQRIFADKIHLLVLPEGAPDS